MYMDSTKNAVEVSTVTVTQFLCMLEALPVSMFITMNWVCVYLSLLSNHKHLLYLPCMIN